MLRNCICSLIKCDEIPLNVKQNFLNVADRTMKNNNMNNNNYNNFRQQYITALLLSSARHNNNATNIGRSVIREEQNKWSQQI